MFLDETTRLVLFAALYLATPEQVARWDRWLDDFDRAWRLGWPEVAISDLYQGIDAFARVVERDRRGNL